MKTTKQVIEQSAIPAKLIRAVIGQLGDKEGLEDIVNHGISSGFNGFIYTRDTVAFFKRHRKEIVALAKQRANECAQPVIHMIASFGCLAGYSGDPSEFTDSVARCLYGRITEDEHDVANALAWFAGEEVARAFCDE